MRYSFKINPLTILEVISSNARRIPMSRRQRKPSTASWVFEKRENNSGGLYQTLPAMGIEILYSSWRRQKNGDIYLYA
jgi:hypothetical protein